jgi:hypothetical protein
MQGEGRRETHERAEDLAHLAEVEPWIEKLHEAEDVSLGRAAGIPPATAFMSHQQDLALGSPILQAVPSALLLVQLPRRRKPLQQHRTAHPCPHLFQFGILVAHRPYSFLRIRSDDRGACAGQGRLRSRRERRRRTLVARMGLSGIGILITSAGRFFPQLRCDRCEESNPS